MSSEPKPKPGTREFAQWKLDFHKKKMVEAIEEQELTAQKLANNRAKAGEWQRNVYEWEKKGKAEGRYHHHAASAKLEAQIDAEAWGTRTNPAILPMLSSLGYPVGYFDERPGAATMGLHLRLEDEKPAVYGLTCRHVVYNDRAPDEIYKPSGEHRQYHVQANHYEFNKCLDGLESIRKGLAARIKPLWDEKDCWEQWYMHDETLKHKCPTKHDIDLLRVYQEAADYNTKIIELLETIEDKGERNIGHLAVHANFEVSSRQRGYLRDRALIELDPHKFTHSPENKVFIGYHQAQIWYTLLDNGLLTLRLKDEDEVDALSTYPVANVGPQPV
ncbi:hypothetical protein SCUP234_04747 [Seiridium cupressi]